jgi:PTH1 family peptidyl-tRNA hydrolase
MKLIVGLGNPGREYEKNRHNVGFMCLNYFARTQGIKFDKKQGKARIGTGEVTGVKVVLARPQTFMNASGEAVSQLVRKFKISPDDLLVIQDDLDLPPGKLRLRRGGGSGGHNGIESIISCLGSQDFIRLRVGTGRPVATGDGNEISDADIIDYVLSDFSAQERRIVTQILPKMSEAIYCLLTEGLMVAMNKYN